MKRSAPSYPVRPLARWLIVVATTALGAVWLALRDAAPVGRTVRILPEQLFFLYMLSAFPILGMLVAELTGILATLGLGPRSLELVIQLVLLILISGIRLAYRVPVSGHSLLFAFALFRWFSSSPAEAASLKIERLIAAAFLLLVAFIKLVLWNDPISWSAGVIAAAVVLVITRYGARIYGNLIGPG